MRKSIKIAVILFAAGLIGFSAYQLFSIYSVYQVGQELYAEVADQVISVNEEAVPTQETDKTAAALEKSATVTVSEAAAPSAAGADGQIEQTTLPITVDFGQLTQLNSDVVGWLYSANTPLNYPIAQAEDNRYYLHRLIDHSESFAGTIFMDHRNAANMTDLNTIIYGHNMKDGSMFGSFEAYSSQEYFADHAELFLTTPQQDYQIELLAGFVTDHTADIYTIPQTADEQARLLAEAKQQSTFSSAVAFGENDRLVTLSTCATEYDTSRYVLVGKLVTIGG